jgi:hypothetical protein
MFFSCQHDADGSHISIITLHTHIHINRALASGLAAAVDTFFLASKPPEEQAEQEEPEAEKNEPHDKEEDEQEGQERRDRRRLSDLLLQALLLLARPLARTRLALTAHMLAAPAAATSTSSTVDRPAGLGLHERAALEAQVLLELLVRAWSHDSASSISSSAAAAAAAASAAAFSRNPRFTPALLLALAMPSGKGAGDSSSSSSSSSSSGGSSNSSNSSNSSGNEGVAALLLEAAGRPEAALDLRLEEAAGVAAAAAAAAPPSSPDNLEGELVALLLGLLRSHVLGPGVEWQARRAMAARVLESWARLRLPPGPLEAVVLDGADGGADGGSGWRRHMLTALFVELLVLHAGAFWGERGRGRGGIESSASDVGRIPFFQTDPTHALFPPSPTSPPPKQTQASPAAPPTRKGPCWASCAFPPISTCACVRTWWTMGVRCSWRGSPTCGVRAGGPRGWCVRACGVLGCIVWVRVWFALVPSSVEYTPRMRVTPYIYIYIYIHIHTRTTRQLQLRFPRPLPALWEALYQQVQGLEAQAAASQRIELTPHKIQEACARSRRHRTLGGMGGARASFQGRRIVVGRGAEEDRVVAFSWCVLLPFCFVVFLNRAHVLNLVAARLTYTHMHACGRIQPRLTYHPILN